MKPELTKTLMALAYNAQCAFAYGHDNYEEQKATLREAIEATELQLDSLQEEVWKLNAMLAAQPAPQQNPIKLVGNGEPISGWAQPVAQPVNQMLLEALKYAHSHIEYDFVRTDIGNVIAAVEAKP